VVPDTFWHIPFHTATSILTYHHFYGKWHLHYHRISWYKLMNYSFCLVTWYFGQLSFWPWNMLVSPALSFATLIAQHNSIKNFSYIHACTHTNTEIHDDW
jgi:hypothetical protein